MIDDDPNDLYDLDNLNWTTWELVMVGVIACCAAFVVYLAVGAWPW